MWEKSPIGDRLLQECVGGSDVGGAPLCADLWDMEALSNRNDRYDNTSL